MKGVLIIIIMLLIAAVSIQAYNWINGNTTTGTVIVSWDPNSEPDMAGYKIYYRTDTDDNVITTDVGNITEYQINELATEQRYYFSVTAYDTVPNESPFSNEVSIYLAQDDTNIVQVNFGYYNFPNPFNPDRNHTFIRFNLKELTMVSITILDHTEQLIKKLVVNELLNPGEHFEPWDGRYESGAIVANGIYYAVIELEGVRKVVQMAVVK
jgi:hypothetical protein